MKRLKGILLGLVSLFVLEFGTLAVLAGFETDRYSWRHDIPAGLIFVANALFAGLLGVSTAMELKRMRQISLALNGGMLLVIILAYGYFVWLRFSSYSGPPVIIDVQ